VTVGTLGHGEVHRLDPLIAGYAFKPYRNYRVLSRRAQAEVLRAEIRQTISHPEGVAVLVADGDAEAVAAGRRLEWDSGFFGVPMGRLEYVMAAASGGALVPHAIQVFLQRLRDAGVRHVSARVDVADIGTTSALEAAGFRLMDALVTYTARPRKEPPRDVREVGAIRAYRPDDRDELLAMAEVAYRGFRGRFHLDPHLSPERADAFYTEWARQSIEGTMADLVLVSEGAAGRLLGFLAFRRREPVSTVGDVPIFGGGLGAAQPDAPGAYAGLIRAGTLWAHEHDGVAECQTQNYNFSTVRIYEAVGAHYVRAEYTLHAWLD
jgi:hypothetical protein